MLVFWTKLIRRHVFAGYGDGHLPDGSDGLNSEIVVYKRDGISADGAQFLGTIDLSTGVISQIVTGLENPGDLAYVNIPSSRAAPLVELLDAPRY